MLKSRVSSPAGAMPLISLRRSPVGGGLRDRPEHIPPQLFASADHFLLLIHGFLVDRAEADASYGKFSRSLEARWRKMATGVCWPGDSGQRRRGWQQRPLLWRLRGLPSYLCQPGRARDSAAKLAGSVADGLRARNRVRARQPLHLHIVAHSMGCRLTLELLELLRKRPELRTGRLALPLAALMAPAVPAYKVGKRGKLRRALTAAADMRVYFSASDLVLRWMFRPGQAGEIDFPVGLTNRGAIGRFGAPDYPGVTSRDSGIGHLAYWSDPLVPREVNGALGSLYPKLDRPGVAVGRTLAARRLTGRPLR